MPISCPLKGPPLKGLRKAALQSVILQQTGHAMGRPSVLWTAGSWKYLLSYAI